MNPGTITTTELSQFLTASPSKWGQAIQDGLKAMDMNGAVVIRVTDHENLTMIRTQTLGPFSIMFVYDPTKSEMLSGGLHLTLPGGRLGPPVTMAVMNPNKESVQEFLGECLTQIVEDAEKDRQANKDVPNAIPLGPCHTLVLKVGKA